MAQRIVGRGPRSCFRLLPRLATRVAAASKKARGNKTSSWNRTRGVAIILVAFMLFVIVLIMGLGLDRARLYMDAHQLQNAADSAALAAAQYVKVGYLAANDPDPNNDYQYPAVVFRTAQEFAKQHITKASRAIVNLDVPNPDEFDETVDVVIGYYRRQARASVPYVTCSDRTRVYPNNVELYMMLQNLGVFTPYDPDDHKAPNAVAVLAQQTASAVNVPVPLIFGSIVGVNTANVQRLAIAISTGSTGAGLIALDELQPYPPPPTGTGLQIGGNSTVNVSNGDIQVNSYSVRRPKEAFRAPSASFELNCEEMNVCGGTSPGSDDPFWDTQDYNVNSYTDDPLPDPLAHIPDLNPLPAIPLVDPITGDSTADWTADIVDSSVIAAEAQQTYTDADG